jgi:hypothetical protein
MHYTGTKLVSDVEISSTLVNKQSEHCVVSMLSNVVQSSEVLISLHIDPISNLLNLPYLLRALIDGLPPSVLEYDLESIGIIQVSAKSQQTEIECVFHYQEVQCLRCSQKMINKPFVVFVIDKFEDPLCTDIRYFLTRQNNSGHIMGLWVI